MLKVFGNKTPREIFESEKFYGLCSSCSIVKTAVWLTGLHTSSWRDIRSRSDTVHPCLQYQSAPFQLLYFQETGNAIFLYVRGSVLCHN